MANVIQQYLSIGQTTSDIPEIKVRKSFLVFLATFMSCGGIIWGSISLAYGLTWQSLIPYGYVAISMINLILFGVLRYFNFARVVQLFISLLLPFLFQWSLGGFFSSGLIMLWAILAVTSAPALGDVKFSLIWMGLYLVLGIVSFNYDGFFVSNKPEILADQSLLFLTLNTLVISTIVFGLVIFYVGQSQKAQQEAQAINDKLKQVSIQLKKKNQQLAVAQEELKQSNSKLEESKVNLERINEKQQHINHMLMKDQGYFKESGNKEGEE
ncbi:MAG: hypothetical protein R8G66_34920 [Cytophagales bacterium]|nr:hypothetical protein [Cytophagales bacterium]